MNEAHTTSASSHGSRQAAWNLSMPLAVLLRDIENRLRRAGIETPDHDARMLVSESLGIESSDIRMAEILNTTLAEAPHRGAHEETGLQRSSDLGILAERVSRRERREPLQHILGHTWFRYIDVQVGNGCSSHAQRPKPWCRPALISCGSPGWLRPG